MSDRIMTLTQSIAYTILCELEMNDNPTHKAWAEKWLSGEDRSAKSATVVALLGLNTVSAHAALAAMRTAQDYTDEAYDYCVEAAAFATKVLKPAKLKALANKAIGY